MLGWIPVATGMTAVVLTPACRIWQELSGIILARFRWNDEVMGQ